MGNHSSTVNSSTYCWRREHVSSLRDGDGLVGSSLNLSAILESLRLQLGGTLVRDSMFAFCSLEPRRISQREKTADIRRDGYRIAPN